MKLTGNAWQHNASFHFRGHLLNTAQESLKLFTEDTAVSEAEAWLTRANGCFAMVYEGKDFTLAAVDRTRSIPLFYTPDGRLADSSEALDPLSIEHILAQDRGVWEEFLITGFVSGNDTLHPNIFQIPAGHYLLLQDGNKPVLKAYHKYQHTSESRLSEKDLSAQLDEIHRKITQRLIDSLNGRCAVIPLSGGWDSRLIAYLLKQANYPSVYAFSYEAKNNPEAQISQKVAGHLNIPWLFVEHTHQSWYRAYFSEERKKHYKYAVNATSSAHIQDWLAVTELKRQNLIPRDSVFIPGHTGDFLQSGHLPPAYGIAAELSKTELIGQILARHYRLWKHLSESEIEGFRRRIASVVEIPEQMSAMEAASLFEYWELQERQAKFIVNSVRVYEDLGYDWRLPLWDAELMDFWAEVPLKFRLGRKLWHLYQRQYLPIPVPVFKNLSLPIRVRNKLLRIAFGEITDVRYGRFAEYRNPLQYASERVENYLRPELKYPSFVDPKRPLIRCDMNALQALRAIFEL